MPLPAGFRFFAGGWSVYNCVAWDNCTILPGLADADGDGVGDACDSCPGYDDFADADADGIPDGCDACPYDPDNDIDADGICGDVDACPNDPDNDIDGDGVCGDVDNCPAVYNPDQEDADGNGIGDACETETLTLPLDIKPESCPNSFNVGDLGILPVCLVGTQDLDVAVVDPNTLLLSRADDVGGSVAPSRLSLEDAATPFVGELCDCHELGADGAMDLSLKFMSANVVSELELADLEPNTLVELVLSGTLYDGTEFIASDCVRIVPSLKIKSVGGP